MGPFRALAVRTLFLGLFLAGCQELRPPSGSGLWLATFECDVSPPVGHPLCGGLRAPVESVEAPLLAKGLVLSDGPNRYVLCAVDWCRIQNSTYDLFRQKIARAADTRPSCVALQCTHCHEAPLADAGIQKALAESPSPVLHLDLEFANRVADRLAEAARASLAHLRPFTEVGWGRGKVERVASNSRVFMPGGKLVERPSVTTSAAIQAQPEGRIDPWVRTVTLFEEGVPLVRMHYYACHPENSMTRGKVLPDIFGPLRRRLEAEEGIPHLYFAACGGDIGMGKYHVPSALECRAGVIDRMVAGIHEAIRTTERSQVSSMAWKTSSVRLVTKSDPGTAESELQKAVGDPSLPPKVRIGAAQGLSWLERVRVKPEIELSCLRLGPVSILHLPGEPFVEYQLYAQSLGPGFVAVAGYGDGGPGYLCTDEACAQGGYQPGSSRVGPPSEIRLREAIAEALR